MKLQRLLKSRISIALFAGLFYLTWKSLAQYFGLDESVVTVARKSLETGNANLVLPWVRIEDEDEIRKVFDQAMSVRKLSEEASELSDTHFFEMLLDRTGGETVGRHDTIRNGVHTHFDAVLRRCRFDPDDVEAGRAYVEAYVPYVHYVERLWQAAQGAGRAHANEQHHAGHGD